jgi:hypothetical protein
MRSVMALGVAITLFASASATMMHRAKPSAIHLRTHRRSAIEPRERVSVPTHFAVPGWTDEQTRYWLDNASAPSGLG